MEKRQSTDACFTISHPHLYYQKTQPRSHGGMSRRDFSKILHSVTTQLQFLLIAVAGWMSQHQQAVIEYLQEENRVLLEQLGGKPKRFTDAQRIRLARKAKRVGRRRLGKLATLVTPDTLLRWFRVLIAKKWTFARTNPVGRPSVDAELEKLVITLLQENPTWGSKRIVGALANLGFKVSDSTVDNIRQRNGLDPAPLRGKSASWRQFLQAHWETLLAADCFTTEVLSWNGLVIQCRKELGGMLNYSWPHEPQFFNVSPVFW